MSGSHTLQSQLRRIENLSMCFCQGEAVPLPQKLFDDTGKVDNLMDLDGNGATSSSQQDKDTSIAKQGYKQALLKSLVSCEPHLVPFPLPTTYLEKLQRTPADDGSAGEVHRFPE